MYNSAVTMMTNPLDKYISRSVMIHLKTSINVFGVIVVFEQTFNLLPPFAIYAIGCERTAVTEVNPAITFKANENRSIPSSSQYGIDNVIGPSVNLQLTTKSC